MIAFHRLAALVAALLLVPSVTRAQAAALQAGARLRLTVPCELRDQPAAGKARTDCRVEGKLVQLRADTLTLAVAESATSYGLSAVNHVEVSRGRKSHALAGAGAGFVVGAGVTFLLLHGGSSTSLCDESANQDAIGSGACLGIAALGGVASAGLGALIGALVRTERWQEVPVGGLRVSVAPRLGGMLGLAVTVPF